MTISKRIVSIVLVFLLALTAVPAIGAVPESELPEGLNYYIEGYGKHSEAVISKYTGNAKELVIPDTIEGYPVTTINNEVFSGCTSLESVTIGKNVDFIQYRAFYNCTNLAEIKILGTVTTIAEEVFAKTAFYENENNWDGDVLYIDGHVIRAKDTLSGSYTIKDGTKVLAWRSFFNCPELTEIIIPDSVTVIGQTAFFCCRKLSSVHMSDNIISMGYWAFYDTAFYNDSNNWENDCLYLGKYLLAAQPWCDSDITVKEGTELIAVAAFFECGGLETITFPESIKYLNQEAFWRCSSLHTITLPKNITTIGMTTFRECKNLKSITIPEGVTTIEDYAFYESGLETIILPNTIEFFGYNSFDLGLGKKNVYIYELESFWSNFPNNSKLLKNANIYYMDNPITEYVFPENITSISAICNGYTNLESVFIPNPELITEIESAAFNNCENLKSFTMPENVTIIGNGAFMYCKNWENPVVPKNIEYIGNNAYYGCNITDFTLPSSVNYVGSGAFAETPFYNNADNWNGNALYKDNVLLNYDQNATASEYVVENGTRLIASSAFNFSGKLISVEIPDTVTTINDKAFRYCTSLTSITIPENVTEIGKDCFEECPEALTIYGYTNSVAERYAKENNIKFESIGTSINTAPITEPITEPDSNPNTNPTVEEGNPDSEPVVTNPTTEPQSKPVEVKPTTTAPESKPADIPVTPSGKMGMEAEVANQETGDILFTYSGVKNAYYYDLTFYDLSVEEMYTRSSETTEYTWAPEDNVYGYVKVTARDSEGKAIEESSLYTYMLMDNEIQLAGTYGDADENFKINIKDATAIQKHLANIIELNDFAVRLADANGDSKVNIKDATTIQKHCANLKPNGQIGEMLTDSYIQKEILFKIESDSTEPTEATDGTSGDFVEPPVTSEVTEPAETTEATKPTIAIPTEPTEVQKPTVQVITTEPTEVQKPTVQVITTEATEPTVQVITTEATKPVDDDRYLNISAPDYQFKNVKVGDKVTYRLDLWADEELDAVQGFIKFDSTKLKTDFDSVFLEGLTTDDDAPIINVTDDGYIYFNSSTSTTIFDFTEKKPLITVEFEATDSGETEISHQIEYMHMLYTDDYYFRDSKPKVTEGITITTVLRDEDELSIELEHLTYSGHIGDTFTYYLELEAEERFDAIQGYITYDGTKLKLIKQQADASYCPILSKQVNKVTDYITNDTLDNKLHFHALEIVDGFDFTEKRTLVMLEFEIISEGDTKISYTIEEMSIFGGESSYFSDSKQLTTDGITLWTSIE